MSARRPAVSADSLLAPLTAAELEALGDKSYRGLNRFLDAAEDHLYAMTSWPPSSARYRDHDRQAHALMAAYRDLCDLHTDIINQVESNLRALIIPAHGTGN